MGDETTLPAPAAAPPTWTPADPVPVAPPTSKPEATPFQSMYTRLVSLDAYRGFIMLAMVTGGLGLPQVARNFPDSEVWQFLGYQTDHVAWTGCAFWDLIQPAFIFMVGVAMPYSHASRVNKGESGWRIAFHTIYRCVLLVLLGVFLSSNWDRMTNWTFANVLCQIGLGYGFVYLLVGRGLGWQLLALTVILVGYGWWFASYSVPPGFNYPQAGVPGPLPWGSEEHFAHWNKNTNAAAEFDVWFLNQFPQPNRVSPTLAVQLGLLNPAPLGFLPSLPYAQLEPAMGPRFFFNSGGYQTLNFIPSMGTMLLGLMAGEMLRRMDLLMREKFLRLVFAGMICCLIGYLLGEHMLPSVKRIWTPTWTIYSTGWTFLMLAAFFAVIDWAEYQRWCFPLLVIGMNSIAVYCMAQLLKPWVKHTLARHLEFNADGRFFGMKLIGPDFAPLLDAVAFTLVVWLIAFWMYRRKIFIKI